MPVPVIEGGGRGGSGGAVAPVPVRGRRVRQRRREEAEAAGRPVPRTCVREEAEGVAREGRGGAGRALPEGAGSKATATARDSDGGISAASRRRRRVLRVLSEIGEEGRKARCLSTWGGASVPVVANNRDECPIRPGCWQ